MEVCDPLQHLITLVRPVWVSHDRLIASVPANVRRYVLERFPQMLYGTFTQARTTGFDRLDLNVANTQLKFATAAAYCGVTFSSVDEMVSTPVYRLVMDIMRAAARQHEVQSTVLMVASKSDRNEIVEYKAQLDAHSQRIVGRRQQYISELVDEWQQYEHIVSPVSGVGGHITGALIYGSGPQSPTGYVQNGMTLKTMFDSQANISWRFLSDEMKRRLWFGTFGKPPGVTDIVPVFQVIDRSIVDFFLNDTLTAWSWFTTQFITSSAQYGVCMFLSDYLEWKYRCQSAFMPVSLNSQLHVVRCRAYEKARQAVDERLEQHRIFLDRALDSVVGRLLADQAIGARDLPDWRLLLEDIRNDTASRPVQLHARPGAENDSIYARIQDQTVLREPAPLLLCLDRIHADATRLLAAAQRESSFNLRCAIDTIRILISYICVCILYQVIADEQ